MTPQPYVCCTSKSRSPLFLVARNQAFLSLLIVRGCAPRTGSSQSLDQAGQQFVGPSGGGRRSIDQFSVSDLGDIGKIFAGIIDQTHEAETIRRIDQVVLASRPASVHFLDWNIVAGSRSSSSNDTKQVDLSVAGTHKYEVQIKPEISCAPNESGTGSARVCRLKAERTPFGQAFFYILIDQFARSALVSRIIPIPETLGDAVGIEEGFRQNLGVLLAPCAFPGAIGSNYNDEPRGFRHKTAVLLLPLRGSSHCHIEFSRRCRTRRLKKLRRNRLGAIHLFEFAPRSRSIHPTGGNVPIIDCAVRPFGPDVLVVAFPHIDKRLALLKAHLARIGQWHVEYRNGRVIFRIRGHVRIVTRSWDSAWNGEPQIQAVRHFSFPELAPRLVSIHYGTLSGPSALPPRHDLLQRLHPDLPQRLALRERHGLDLVQQFGIQADRESLFCPRARAVCAARIRRGPGARIRQSQSCSFPLPFGMKLLLQPLESMTRAAPSMNDRALQRCSNRLSSRTMAVGHIRTELKPRAQSGEQTEIDEWKCNSCSGSAGRRHQSVAIPAGMGRGNHEKMPRGARMAATQP